MLRCAIVKALLFCYMLNVHYPDRNVCPFGSANQPCVSVCLFRPIVLSARYTSTSFLFSAFCVTYTVHRLAGICFNVSFGCLLMILYINP